MRKLISLNLLLFTMLSISAQHKATTEQQHYMYQKITSAATTLKSLQCHFIQTKEVSVLNSKMISKGMMYYRGNQLCWEYTSPYQYTFIISGNKVMIKSEKTKNIIDVRSSKLFQEITGVMMSSVNGTGLNNSSYSVSYYYESPLWRIVLFPKVKAIKKIFKSIVLYIDPSDYQVDKVIMNEINGDNTFINLSDKKINKAIADEKFTIR